MGRQENISSAFSKVVEKLNYLNDNDLKHIDYANGAIPTDFSSTELIEVLQYDFNAFTLYRKIEFNVGGELIEDSFYEDSNLTILRTSKLI